VRAVQSGGQIFHHAIATISGIIPWKAGTFSQHNETQHHQVELSDEEEIEVQEDTQPMHHSPNSHVDYSDCWDCMLVREETANKGAIDGTDDFRTHCRRCANQRLLPFSHLYSSQETPPRFRPCVMLEPDPEASLVLFGCGTKRVDSNRLLEYTKTLANRVDHREQPKPESTAASKAGISPPDHITHDLTLSSLESIQQFSDSDNEGSGSPQNQHSPGRFDFDNRTLTQSPIEARRGDLNRSPLTRLKHSFLSRANPPLVGVEDFFSWRERIHSKHAGGRRDVKRERSPPMLRSNPARTERWNPEPDSPPLEELSSSVSDGEFQHAMGQKGPPSLFKRRLQESPEPHFASYLPPELRLEHSKIIAETAKTRTKQSTLLWGQRQATGTGPLFETQGSQRLQEGTDSQSVVLSQSEDTYVGTNVHDQSSYPIHNQPLWNTWHPRATLEVYLNRAAFDNRPHREGHMQEVFMSMRKFVEIVTSSHGWHSGAQAPRDRHQGSDTMSWASTATMMTEQESNQLRSMRESDSEADPTHAVKNLISGSEDAQDLTNHKAGIPNQAFCAEKRSPALNAEHRTVVLSSGPRASDGRAIFVSIPMSDIESESSGDEMPQADDDSGTDDNWTSGEDTQDEMAHEEPANPESSDDDLPELVTDESSTDYTSEDSSQYESDEVDAQFPLQPHFQCQCPWGAAAGECTNSTSQPKCPGCSCKVQGCQCGCENCKQGDRIRVAIRALEYELHQHQGTISVCTWRRVCALRRVNRILRLRLIRASVRAMCEQYFRTGLNRQP
jgi:hypothetical protein